MGKVYLKDRPFVADVVAGGLSGAFTGMIVAPVEALKIEFQLRPNEKHGSILRDSNTHINMLKSIKPFATIFSMVCALEFSVNERIKHKYGEMTGIFASALTGSGFLTVADHLMFRRQQNENTTKALKNLFNIRCTAIWTGFTPMVAREAIFISSVMYLGPALGKKLQKDKEQNSLYWNSVGRLIMGVTTTLLSQPFDVMAREMQIQLYKKPEQRPNLLTCFNNLNNKLQNGSHLESIKQGGHPYFKGAAPRIGLATFGGMLAGGFFQEFRNSLYYDYANDNVPHIYENKPRNMSN